MRTALKVCTAMNRVNAVPPLAQASGKSAVWDAAARCAATKGVQVGDTLSRVADPASAATPTAAHGDALSAMTVRRGTPYACTDWFLPRYITSHAHAVCVLRKHQDALAFVMDASSTRVVMWWHGVDSDDASIPRDSMQDAAFLTRTLHASNAPGKPVTCVCVVQAPREQLSSAWTDVYNALFDAAHPTHYAAAPSPGMTVLVLPEGCIQPCRRINTRDTPREKWVHVVQNAVSKRATQTLHDMLAPTACTAPSIQGAPPLQTQDAARAAVQWIREAPTTSWSTVFQALNVDAIVFLSATRRCPPTAAPPLTPWLASQDDMVHSMHAALAFAPPHVKSKVCIIDGHKAYAPHLPRCVWVQAPPLSQETGAAAAESAAHASHDASSGQLSSAGSPYTSVYPDVPHSTPLYGSVARRACLLFLLKHGASMRDAVMHFSS